MLQQAFSQIAGGQVSGSSGTITIASLDTLHSAYTAFERIKGARDTAWEETEIMQREVFDVVIAGSGRDGGTAAQQFLRSGAGGLVLEAGKAASVIT